MLDLLIDYLIHEIGMDASLGSAPNSLIPLVRDFYDARDAAAAAAGGASTSRKQKVDDAYLAFVWQLLVQQEGVVVGKLVSTHPAKREPVDGSGQLQRMLPAADDYDNDNDAEDAGATGEPSAALDKGKGRAISLATTDEGGSGVEPVHPVGKISKTGDLVGNVRIEPLELHEYLGIPLSRLQDRFGGTLRVTLTAESTFRVLTGGHPGHVKINETLYQALAFIARTKEKGFTSVQLGKALGVDQKMAFYYIKRLTELDLIVKFHVTERKAYTARLIHRRYHAKNAEYNLYVDSKIKAADDYTLSDDLPELTASVFNNVDIMQRRLLDALARAPQNALRNDKLIEAMGWKKQRGKMLIRSVQRTIRIVKARGLIKRVYLRNNNPYAPPQPLPRAASMADTTEEDVKPTRLPGVRGIQLVKISKEGRANAGGFTVEGANDLDDEESGHEDGEGGGEDKTDKVDDVLLGEGEEAEEDLTARTAAAAEEEEEEELLGVAKVEEMAEPETRMIDEGDPVFLDDEDVPEASKTYVPTFKVGSSIPIERQMLNLVEESGTAGITFNRIIEALGCTRRFLDNFTDHYSGKAPSHLSRLGLVTVVEFLGKEKTLILLTAENYRRNCETLDLSAAAASSVKDYHPPDDADANGGFLDLGDYNLYQTAEEYTSWFNSFPLKHMPKLHIPEASGFVPKSMQPPPARGARPKGKPPVVAKDKRRKSVTAAASQDGGDGEGSGGDDDNDDALMQRGEGGKVEDEDGDGDMAGKPRHKKPRASSVKTPKTPKAPQTPKLSKEPKSAKTPGPGRRGPGKKTIEVLESVIAGRSPLPSNRIEFERLRRAAEWKGVEVPGLTPSRGGTAHAAPPASDSNFDEFDELEASSIATPVRASAHPGPSSDAGPSSQPAGPPSSTPTLPKKRGRPRGPARLARDAIAAAAASAPTASGEPPSSPLGSARKRVKRASMKDVVAEPEQMRTQTQAMETQVEAHAGELAQNKTQEQAQKEGGEAEAEVDAMSPTSGLAALAEASEAHGLAHVEKTTATAGTSEGVGAEVLSSSAAPSSSAAQASGSAVASASAAAAVAEVEPEAAQIESQADELEEMEGVEEEAPQPEQSSSRPKQTSESLSSLALNSTPVRLSKKRPYESDGTPTGIYGYTSSGKPLKRPRAKPKPDYKVDFSRQKKDKYLFDWTRQRGGIWEYDFPSIAVEHAAWLRTITDNAQAKGQDLRIRGTVMDKRTFDQTIARLEDRGLFTTKSVAWTNPEGSVKTSKFVMVVDYPAEEFSAFAEATRAKKEQLKKAAQASKKEEAVDVVEIDLGAGPPPKVVVELPDMKDIVRLVEADDETARATFLSEWRTCSQMFGYQPAPLIRAELFHKALGEMLERLAVNDANGSAATVITTSSVIVSANERILHLGAFISFLSLELFCQLVPLKRTDPELEALMADPAGKKTTVRELPARLRSVIDVDTNSTVHYVQRIVRMLFNLRLARPLIISDEDLENREIIVSVPVPAPVAAPAASMSMSADSGDTSVLAALGGETSISTVDFALDNSDEFTHIQVFSGRAPVYGLHDKPAPLLAVVPVDTAEDLTAFWKLQRGVVLGTAVSPEDPPSASAFPSVYEASNAKVISRLDYWTSEYFVTPLQRSYIQHIVEHQGEGEVPILDDRVELERRARIISAPIKITEAVCRKAVNKIERHRRLIELEKNRAAKRLKKTAQEALAAKLANERMQLASDWTAMARRYLTQRNVELTPELELRIGHLQRREALKAVSGGRGRLDPDVVAEAVDGLLGAPTQPEELQPVPQSPIVPPPEKKKRGRPPKPKPAPEPEPELQEPPRSEEGAAAYEPVGEGDDYLIPEVCRIMLAKPHEIPKGKRRKRTKFTQELDDAVIDFAAITLARARIWEIQATWGPADKVIQCLPHNAVRLRFLKLREDPVINAFIGRLKHAYIDLHKKFGGTTALPDKDKRHRDDYDAVYHFKFFRKNIQRELLRDSAVADDDIVAEKHGRTPARTGNGGGRTPALPTNVADLASWNLRDEDTSKPPGEEDWAWLYDRKRHESDERAERHMAELPFLVYPRTAAPIPKLGALTVKNEVGLVSAAIKMITGTLDAVFDPELADAILPVTSALPTIHSALIADGVLCKDKERVQYGYERAYVFTDYYAKRSEGPISRSLFVEAKQLGKDAGEDRLIVEDNFQVWPFTASEGATAALVDLVSAGWVEFETDFDDMKQLAARGDKAFNTKKLTDDMIEYHVSVRLLPAGSKLNEEPGETTIFDLPATCPLEIAPFKIDADARRAALDRLTTEPSLDGAYISALEEALVSAGKDGLTWVELLALGPKLSPARLRQSLSQLARSNPPIVFWTGYDQARLVSSLHAVDWAVTIPSATKGKMVYPKRWLDVRGKHSKADWRQAVRLVLGWLQSRPGIRESVLRQILASILDRQELNAVLRHVLREGLAHRHLVLDKTAAAAKVTRVVEENEDAMVAEEAKKMGVPTSEDVETEIGWTTREEEEVIGWELERGSRWLVAG